MESPFKEIEEMWYFTGGMMLEIDLKALTNDKGSMEMIDITKRDGSGHLFVLHPVLKQAKNVQVPNNLVGKQNVTLIRTFASL